MTGTDRPGEGSAEEVATRDDDTDDDTDAVPPDGTNTHDEDAAADDSVGENLRRLGIDPG